MTNDHLGEYLDHLRVERRLAAHTLESYGRDLEALAKYAAAAERRIEALDRGALEAFVRQQMASGLSPRSVARRVAAIRGFYRFLVLDRRIEHSPADDLQPPRAWPALPKLLSLSEVDALIAQPDVTTPLGLRDRAMIELLYATGLRVTELVSVRFGDLHLDEAYLTCVGKGSKERLVPIGDQAAQWIRRYQRDGRPQLTDSAPKARDTVFVNARGGRLTRVGFWKILKRHGRTRAAAAHAQPARPAPLVRDAPARERRRPARHSTHAGPRRSLDDANLHARPRNAPANHLRPVSPTRLILLDLTVSRHIRSAAHEP